MNVVITGGTRGIGLELVKVALGKGCRVVTVARNPGDSRELVALTQKYPDQLETVALDLGELESIGKLSEVLREWPHVDLLINNAGIMRSGTTAADFAESFRINSIAPFMICETLRPWLKKSKAAKAIHVTSRMGSIADNTSGGYYAYRSSKAALNMINKSIATDQKWLSTIVVHPGWVKTDMGGSTAPVEPLDSAAGIWALAESLTPEKSGRFFEFRGEEIPW